MVEQSSAGHAPGFDKYPGYTVTRQPVDDEVVVRIAEVELCRSSDAIWLQESKHKPALYLPRKDVPARLLENSATSTYCPFKGTASYHSALGVTDVVWYYPKPYVEVDYLADYVGLYQDRVSSITFGGV